MINGWLKKVLKFGKLNKIYGKYKIKTTLLLYFFEKMYKKEKCGNARLLRERGVAIKKEPHT